LLKDRSIVYRVELFEITFDEKKFNSLDHKIKKSADKSRGKNQGLFCTCLNRYGDV
jgi:hypothetical protein